MHSLRNYEQSVARMALSIPVTAALDNNMSEARLISRHDPCPLLGSPLFNALSAALQVLSKNPEQKLTRKTIPLPSDHGRPIRLASKIFNANHIPGKYTQPTNVPPIQRRIDTGISNEIKLASSLDLRAHEDEITPIVYLSGDKKPTLVQFAPDRAISVGPIKWHRIRLPAGVLGCFNEPMAEQPKDKHVDSFVVRALSSDQANSFAPQRFSPIAFLPDNIPDVFTPTAPHITDQSAIVAMAPSYADIINQLPIQNRQRVR